MSATVTEGTSYDVESSLQVKEKVTPKIDSTVRALLMGASAALLCIVSQACVSGSNIVLRAKVSFGYWGIT